MKIQSIIGRSILDSRSNWTLEVEVRCEDGSVGRAAVPSGAAIGAHEAKKLENIDRAVGNVNAIAPSLIGQEVINQPQIDQLMIEMDGTPEKSNLGANVVYGISMAIADAAAKAQQMHLFQWIGKLSGITNTRVPTPLFNLINGGKHANNNLPFQEFCVTPMPGKPYSEQLTMGLKIANSLKDILHERGHSTMVGDEGGYAPWIQKNEDAMNLLVEAIQAAGFQVGADVMLAVDVAASNIPDLSAVTYPLAPNDYFAKLIQDYPILLLEDPLDQEDWVGWASLTTQIGQKVILAGDDLFNTNVERLRRGVTEQSANAIVIKPDDVGTLTEVLQAVALAQTSNYKVIVSHRAGETESTMIADLSVGIGADFIKAGGLSRSERTAKYNQLLRIEAVMLESGIKNWA
jgi:enolase